MRDDFRKTNFNIRPNGDTFLDAIEILLDDAHPGLARLAFMPGSADLYALQIDNELTVNLHEDPGTHRISFFAAMGYLEDADWLSGRPDCWSCEVRDNADDPEASRTLHIDPGTRLVMAVHSLPRAHLDTVRFREELERFASVSRFWKPLLLTDATSDSETSR